MGLQDKLNALREQSMSKIPKATATIMTGAIAELKEAGITDRSKRKGDLAPGFELPVPATYVVDKNSRIVLDFMDVNHTIRLEPSRIVEAVKEISI